MKSKTNLNELFQFHLILLKANEKYGEFILFETYWECYEQFICVNEDRFVFVRIKLNMKHSHK